MKIKQVMVDGPTFKVGKSMQARERFASDGPLHVEFLSEHWIGIWHDDDDDDGVIIHASRVKEIRVKPIEIMRALDAKRAAEALPAEETNGTTGSVRHQAELGGVVKRGK